MSNRRFVDIPQWGTIRLYRTAMPHQARGMPETDVTPLAFDRRGILLGWGRDFLSEHIKRYALSQGMHHAPDNYVPHHEGYASYVGRHRYFEGQDLCIFN
jgi:hypothetical protein